MKNYLKVFNVRSSSAGFTLIELMIAMALTTIVVSIAGFGLVAMTSSNTKAEAKTQRRIELSRASDFIMDEIRMARRVNTTTTSRSTAGDAVVAANTAIAFEQAENNTSTPPKPSTPALGVNLTDSSARDKIVLYLEIPIIGNIPATCPASGPNAGKAPPSPSTYDRVVYDIRSSTSTWLPFRTINRYGRIPANDGTIDPCSNPVANQVLVDSIVDISNTTPTCSASSIPSGTVGFYTCVDGRIVDIYLRGRVTSTENYDLNSKGFARVAP